MRKFIAPLLVFLSLVGSANATGWKGAYIWGGLLTASSTSGPQQFYDSVNYVLLNGFDTVRFKIGPNQEADYNLPANTYCVGNQNLACYAQVMLNSTVWDNPNLKRIMLTTIDFTASASAPANAGLFNPTLLAANQTAIEAEYTALLTYLNTRFAGRSIQFIISNWEGDNVVYCGAVYSFATNPTFSTACRAGALSSHTNAYWVQGLLTWFSYKDAAIAAFVAANPSFNVIHAPEFSSFNQFAGGCGGNCVATDLVEAQIAAGGGRAYCSYSSYNSQSGANGEYLGDARSIITNACKTGLILGEMGLSVGTGGSDSTPAAAVANFQGLAQLRQTTGILGVIPWHAFDPPTPGTGNLFGQFDTTGRPFQINLDPDRPIPVQASQRP